MDDVWFDALSRAATREWSRRGTLRLLASGVVGSLLTAFGVPRTEATHFGCRDVGARCSGGAQCCSGICSKRHKCRAHHVGICKAGQDACVTGSVRSCGAVNIGDCLCYITTGGGSFCGSGRSILPCTHDKECVPISGKGAACVWCASAGGTACVSRCPKPD